MKIQGTLTAQDYRAAPRPAWWAAIFLILFLPIHFTWDWPAMPYLLIDLAFVAIVLSSLIFRPSLENQFLRHPELQGLRTFDITPAALTINGAGSLTTAWRDRYSRYRVSRDVIVLRDYYGGCELFPRRWFTDEQYAEFQSLLRTAFKRPKS